MIINHNVKILRDETRLSGRQFAQKIKVSPQTLANIEKGRGFTTEIIYQIKNVYKDIDLNWLFTGVGEKHLPSNNKVTEKDITYKKNQRQEPDPDQLCNNICPEMKERINELNRTIELLSGDLDMYKRIIDLKLLDLLEQ